MDLRRLRPGEWITAASGLVLAIALFLPWYSLGGANVSGWDVLTVVDVLLALVALAAVAVFLVTATQPTAATPIASQALLTIVSGIALVVVLVRVLNIPGDLEGTGAGRAAGAYLGLLATAGVLAGALLAMRDERISDPRHPTDSTGVPVAATPEVETLPAPPRGAPQA